MHDRCVAVFFAKLTIHCTQVLWSLESAAGAYSAPFEEESGMDKQTLRENYNKYCYTPESVQTVLVSQFTSK